MQLLWFIWLCLKHYLDKHGAGDIRRKPYLSPHHTHSAEQHLKIQRCNFLRTDWWGRKLLYRPQILPQIPLCKCPMSYCIVVSVQPPAERNSVKEHVCLFDRKRRERDGQSHGETARSRASLFFSWLDWLKQTNPSGQAVGRRQALPGPRGTLLLLYTKLFQMIYGLSLLAETRCCSPFIHQSAGWRGLPAQCTGTRH